MRTSPRKEISKAIRINGPITFIGDFYEMLEYLEMVVEYAMPYYEISNCKAHRIDHALDVCMRALKINIELNLNIDERMIIVATIMHDIVSGINHKDHHNIAAYFIRSDDFRNSNIAKIFDDHDIEIIAMAVLQHRASNVEKSSYHSALSELLATSDRGLLDIDITIKRALEYSNGDLNKSLKHIKSKYGSDGYAEYPAMFSVYHGIDNVINFKKAINTLTIEDIATVGHKHNIATF